MTDGASQKQNSVESDIVFECPGCFKSYAIDAAAGGRVFTCLECKQEMEIPYTTDADRDDAVPIERVKYLIDSYDELNERRESLERLRADMLSRFDRIREEIMVIQGAIDRIVSTTE